MSFTLSLSLSFFMPFFLFISCSLHLLGIWFCWCNCHCDLWRCRRINHLNLTSLYILQTNHLSHGCHSWLIFSLHLFILSEGGFANCYFQRLLAGLCQAIQVKDQMQCRRIKLKQRMNRKKKENETNKKTNYPNGCQVSYLHVQSYKWEIERRNMFKWYDNVMGGEEKWKKKEVEAKPLLFSICTVKYGSLYLCN